MPFDAPPPLARPCRTLFLSDLHLGAIGARPDLLLAMLRASPAQTYVLVGDVLDLWHPLLPHWSAQDQAVIDHLRDRQAEGARLVYVRGNHDPRPDRAPAHARLDVGAVDRHVHLAADGRRYLVVHGDEVDSRLVRWHAMTRLGSRVDHLLRRGENALRALRGRAPGETRSLVEAGLCSLNALAYARRNHEARLVELARRGGFDGVICGHFHIAGLHRDHGLTYANCGDWVDSFTAVQELPSGGLRLAGGRALRPAARPVGAALPALQGQRA